MKTSLTTKLATAAAATGLAFAALAGPAHAQTTATFQVQTGSLAITMPASGALTGAGAAVATGATTAAGQLGVVTVADSRGILVNAWTSTVSSTTFVTGTASENETVAKNKITYTSGAGTGSGLGAFVESTSVSLATAVPGAGWTGAAGNNSTTWNPTMSFVLLPSQVAGTYTGTVTHSVA